MGAHTIGMYHFLMTGFKYVWTPRNEMSFNNEYYRNMVMEKNYHFDFDNCVKQGDAYHNKPNAVWDVKANLFTTTGGPIQWIKFNHIGTSCEMTNPGGNTYLSCCEGKADSQQCKPDVDRPPLSDSLAA